MSALKLTALSAISCILLGAFSSALVGQHPQISFAVDFTPKMPVSPDLKNLWVVVQAWPNASPADAARNKRLADCLVGYIELMISDWAVGRDIKVLQIDADALAELRKAVEAQARVEGKDVGESLSSMKKPDAYLQLSLRADARVEEADATALGRIGITQSFISKVLVECNAECVAMNGVVNGAYKEVLETREFAEIGVIEGKPVADMGSAESRMKDIAFRHARRLVSNMIGLKANWRLDLPGLSGYACLAKRHLEQGDFATAMRIGVLQWQRSIQPGSGVAPDFNAGVIAEIAYFGMGQTVQAESLDSIMRARAREMRVEVPQCGDIMWICQDPSVGRIVSRSFSVPSSSVRP